MAFKALLAPHGWVVRTITPDYGIDEQVEVFANGQTTGLFFYVQIRATDQTDLPRALQFRLRPQQAAYFTTIDEPVLLVRYLAPTQSLYYQWFHRIDTHVGLTRPSLRLDPAARLLPNSVQPLADEVRLFRTLRNARVRWPFRVHLITTVPTMSNDELAIAFDAAAGDNQRYVRYTPKPWEGVGAGSVAIRDDHVVVHLGLASITFHGNPVGEINVLANNVVFMTGLSLGTLDHFDAAAKLMVNSSTIATVLSEPDIYLRAAGVMARGRRIRDAVSMARQLALRGELPGSLFISQMVASTMNGELNAEEVHLVSDYFLELVQLASTAENDSTAAAVSYSAANWLAGPAANYTAALDALVQAADLDSSYLGRAYYLCERAAALFETGRFTESAEWYKRAIDIEDDPGTRARRADALMEAGHYVEAASEFRMYESRPIAAEPVWLLKAAALRHIMAVTGGSPQERDPEAARSLGRAAQVADSRDEILQLATAALQQDRLSHDGWFAVARALVNYDLNYNAAKYPAVIGAIGDRTPDVWGEALLIALAAGDAPLATLVCNTAVLDKGVKFTEAVRRKVADYPPASRQRILQYVTDMVAAAPQRPRKLTMRLASRGELWGEFEWEAPD